MDRLTYRDAEGYANAFWFPEIAQSELLLTVFERLCAYEDTGLMPEEVSALRAENERLRAAYEAPPTPLTPEELDAMNNEPVFIQTGDGQEFWFLCDKEWPYEIDQDPDFINMTSSFDPDGHFGLHVLGWQAFRRKPE